MKEKKTQGPAWLHFSFFIVFGIELLYSMTWILARPISELESSGLNYEAIPPDALTFINNRGSAFFSSHGTIPEDPVGFAIWVGIVLLTIVGYRLIIARLK
jgi:hypothetical protein